MASREEGGKRVTEPWHVRVACCRLPSALADMFLLLLTFEKFSVGKCWQEGDRDIACE